MNPSQNDKHLPLAFLLVLGIYLIVRFSPSLINHAKEQEGDGRELPPIGYVLKDTTGRTNVSRVVDVDVHAKRVEIQLLRTNISAWFDVEMLADKSWRSSTLKVGENEQ